MPGMGMHGSNMPPYQVMSMMGGYAMGAIQTDDVPHQTLEAVDADGAGNEGEVEVENQERDRAENVGTQVPA